jgi:hypothetical protein
MNARRSSTSFAGLIVIPALLFLSSCAQTHTGRPEAKPGLAGKLKFKKQDGTLTPSKRKDGVPPGPPPLPDLKIISIHYVKTHARIWVANVGEGPAGPFIVSLRLSAVPNNTWSTTVAGLGPNQLKLVDFDIFNKPEWLMGTKTVVVDSKKQVDETNEKNNESESNFPPAGVDTGQGLKPPF